MISDRKATWTVDYDGICTICDALVVPGDKSLRFSFRHTHKGKQVGGWKQRVICKECREALKHPEK